MKRRSFLSLLLASPAAVALPEFEMATFRGPTVRRYVLPFPALELPGEGVGELVMRPTRPFLPDQLVVSHALPVNSRLRPVPFDILGLDATSEDEPEQVTGPIPSRFFEPASHMPRLYFAPVFPTDEIVLRVRAHESGHIVCCLCGIAPDTEDT